MSSLLILWVIGSILVALAGRHRNLGCWGFFVLSLVFTPVLVGILLLLTAPSERVRYRGAEPP